MNRHVLTMLALLTILQLGAAPATQTAPAGEEEAGNKLRSTPNDVHGILMDSFPEVCTDGARHAPAAAANKESALQRVFTSRVFTTPFPFNDLVPSWNINVPEGAGFMVELRVGRAEGDYWTPWYYLGRWGAMPRPAKRMLRDENGFINIDYFQSKNRFDRIQYRIHFAAPDAEHPAVLRQVVLAYSNTLNDADLARRFRQTIDPGPKEKWARRLPVPFRSQKWESEDLRNQICSPTSTSMVLEYRGAKHPTTEVCARIYDAEYRMYGNWWRAVQGAWTYGVPGYIERFGDWNAVKRHIARGQPVIASIRILKGQMRTAPNRTSAGHLIVIVGFDGDGNVLVNDPAASTPEAGMTMYHREDMEKIWMNRGGVGYILLSPEKRVEARR